jgi:hypothetical protein
MKKLFLLLILSFFSAHGLAASCPDGSEPAKSISDDGTYFVFNCGGQEPSSIFVESQNSGEICGRVNFPNDVASGATHLCRKTSLKLLC